jgi:ferredoxin
VEGRHAHPRATTPAGDLVNAAGTGEAGTGAAGNDAAADRRWRIAVDGDTCIGSGMCASIAPNRFRLEGSTSRPLVELIGEEEGVIDAAESCPVEAISVRNAETGELIAPVF